MNFKIEYKKAEIADLKEIVKLLIEDNLGQNREVLGEKEFEIYKKAFAKIDEDKNQYLLVMKNENVIIGTCHLTILPSLTYVGSSRLMIEAVRVKKEYRGLGIGGKMIEFVKDFARKNECKIVQLTTDKKRKEAQNFYEKLGFKASHEGMKFFVEK